MNTAPAYVPLTKPSEVGKEEPIPKLDDANRDRVLKAYLKKWQEEHNSAVADCGEEVETDPMIVLQENWLNAQASCKCRFRKTHRIAAENPVRCQKTVPNLKPHRLRAGKRRCGRIRYGGRRGCGKRRRRCGRGVDARPNQYPEPESRQPARSVLPVRTGADRTVDQTPAPASDRYRQRHDPYGGAEADGALLISSSKCCTSRRVR